MIFSRIGPDFTMGKRGFIVIHVALKFARSQEMDSAPLEARNKQRTLAQYRTCGICSGHMPVILFA
jgi:hypothetical protein